MKDQMLPASISDPSNIAGGSGKNSKPDLQRFLNTTKESVETKHFPRLCPGKITHVVQ
ncbi:MAG: four helix bundle protein [Planctomycetes bacterium]|nr:four helix bundle protein [Planctomycetota bacterium]